MLGHFKKSLPHAIRGLHYVWREEKNFFIQSLIGTLALVAAYLLEISRTDWLFLIMATGLVLGSEVLNTILEEICDEIEPNHHPVVGKVKDMMAGFVLVSSLAALAMGGLIFLPYLL